MISLLKSLELSLSLRHPSWLVNILPVLFT